MIPYIFELTIVILDKRFGKTIPLPDYSPGSRKIDLLACLNKDIILVPNQRLMVPCGISLRISGINCAMFIVQGSPLEMNHFIQPTLAGFIDNNYTDEINISLWNYGNNSHLIRVGDKIAEGFFASVFHPTSVNIRTKIE